MISETVLDRNIHYPPPPMRQVALGVDRARSYMERTMKTLGSLNLVY